MAKVVAFKSLVKLLKTIPGWGYLPKRIFI
jgi:hypothetical protein